MNISKYNYPHPILGKSGNFYEEIQDILPEFEFIDSYHIIKLNLNIKNQTINGLISTGKAKFLCEISCSSTFYRKVVTASTDTPYIIKEKIHKNLLRNKVEILFLVVADKTISDYHPIGVNDYYSNKKYLIDAGDVLAFIGNYYRNVDMEGDESNDFIKFIKDDFTVHLKYDLSSDYIRIRIPTSQFNQLLKLKNDLRFNHILISSYVVPALQNALSYFLTEQNEDDIHSNFQWFQFLDFKIKEILAQESNLITIEQIPEITEKLLNDSSKRLIESLMLLSNDYFENEEDYE